MNWNAARVWRASEPGWPIVFLVGIVGLNALFNVHTDAGAALVGLGIGCAIFVGVFLLQARLKRYGVNAEVLHPLLLQWGAAFAIAGALMMRLEEPWKFWGAGLLFIGALYIVLGLFDRMRKSLSAR